MWRLEESGIHNSVAIFGTSVSVGQTQLINSSGALSLIVLLDNGEAGKAGMKKIQEQFGRLYRLYYPTISAEDVGEMNTDEITREIYPIIQQIERMV